MGFGGKEPAGEVMKSGIVGSIEVLSEEKEIGPGEVGVVPRAVHANHIQWGSHHFVFFWAHKECQ